MEKKTYRGRIEFKGEDQPGHFRAEFATLNVIDHDQDVTEPGAFQDGQETVIEAWNHNYDGLPAGKGVIHEEGDKAVFEGQFFLDTLSGMEHYKTVKNLENLQQWSYTFGITDSGLGTFGDEDVRFLRGLDVWGVAPVQRGAGINTRTTDIKGQSEEQKPYPNEHSCRLEDPSQFVRCIRKDVKDTNEVDGYEPTGKPYTMLICYTEGDEESKVQAFRYKKDVWTAAQARKHCRAHDGTFEAAADEGKVDDEGQASDGEPSGVPPGDILLQIEIMKLQSEV